MSLVSSYHSCQKQEFTWYQATYREGHHQAAPRASKHGVETAGVDRWGCTWMFDTLISKGSTDKHCFVPDLVHTPYQALHTGIYSQTKCNLWFVV